MVYCGKASQGCQSCRGRRIKCDKVLPQCTQCIRVGKICPGYRDQLSLMFRDESTKVIRKAHAQWGASEAGESSGSSPTSASTGASPASSQSSQSLTPPSGSQSSPTSLHKEIGGTKVDRAIQFYIEHYVIGLPDEPQVGQELRGKSWVHTPETRGIMAAVGLASLSNLTGDKEMQTLANQQYGVALRTIVNSLKNIQGLDLEVSLRAVVNLALFEVVRVQPQVVNPARTHIMGAAALLASLIPISKSPKESLRAQLQLCFSMLGSIQCSLQLHSPEPNVLIPQTSTNSAAPGDEGILPAIFLNWVATSESRATAPDSPSAKLLGIATRLVQLLASVRSHVLFDGRSGTAAMILDALQLNTQLDAWEQGQDGIWNVIEGHADDGFFPPEAVFEGHYHVYSNMWTARVWSHYRCARLSVDQLLLEAVKRYPICGQSLVSAGKQQNLLDCINRLARDTLISIPNHYRHPRLARMHRDYFDKTKGGAGIGAAGIPTLAYHIKTAGSAPGVPLRYRAWALGILDTMWADTGMFHVKALADNLSRIYQEHLQKDDSREILKAE
ncbi:hypothetical protein B0H63DRAFT_403914 [Podospora didyma]|uniref:Zn(2)-C6 fungal-type domain-containing protein n=1 Tax=Podospora didyma TaxID=330526 RepID=A0AAE0K1X5_9PEZI|nr:hypothetical protein B0H63DRAFT_403914 [Podospora didyma]